VLGPDTQKKLHRTWRFYYTGWSEYEQVKRTEKSNGWGFLSALDQDYEVNANFSRRRRYCPR
jgi:hypothetical protein